MQNGERTGPEPPVELDRTNPAKPEKRVKVRLSFFFDGTGNNRVNIRHRLASKSNPESAAIVEKYGKKDSSYFNDFSNVVRLEENVEEVAAGYKYYFKVYTEGIGTMDAGKDPFFGNVMGKGESGVKSRVEDGRSVRHRVGVGHRLRRRK